MNAQGYKAEPLSTELELRIQNRLTWMKLHLVELRKMAGTAVAGVYGRTRADVAVHHTEGNIGALEWVLREADEIKQGVTK